MTFSVLVCEPQKEKIAGLGPEVMHLWRQSQQSGKGSRAGRSLFPGAQGAVSGLLSQVPLSGQPGPTCQLQLHLGRGAEGGVDLAAAGIEEVHRQRRRLSFP